MVRIPDRIAGSRVTPHAIKRYVYQAFWVTWITGVAARMVAFVVAILIAEAFLFTGVFQLAGIYQPERVYKSALFHIASADDTTAAQQGKFLARTHCVRCHVVEAGNRFTGIGSTPSFSVLVNALPDWEERFATFHLRPLHPSIVRLEGEAPPTEQPATTFLIHLKQRDIERLSAFAHTLRKNPHGIDSPSGLDVPVQQGDIPTRQPPSPKWRAISNE